ncbi:hypothetical protein AAJ76_1200018591 [Vairimorpha ceranae]|uniref:Uncharacterized protein n=1 Tax=Vairimorpha ceranae TaxID=40302 RepID=A0A0F9ZE11_9MICR|nr:hypothetical protein AAJ76_1200018591 [Vairimorpha ceranae]KAF5140927.1 hypothetical protein G9O61_00g009170 [Vairimorpha ceranae]KKO75774.1 hypothetical protein AAJ76_1200018591 [Vairimorpha ceranae]
MGRRFDIIQTPKDFNHTDLPSEITISKPFKINQDTYVCEKTSVDGFKIYNEKEDCGTNKHYYVIRKL